MREKVLELANTGLESSLSEDSVSLIQFFFPSFTHLLFHFIFFSRSRCRSSKQEKRQFSAGHVFMTCATKRTSTTTTTKCGAGRGERDLAFYFLF